MSGRAVSPWCGIALGLALFSAGGAWADDLRVCVAEDNAPFSASADAARGIDVELAEALGRRLGRAVRFEWVRIPNRGGLGKALNRSLAAGRCDVFAGIPYGGEVREDLAGKGLVASAPYLATAYVLVRAPGRRVGALADLHLGAVTATPADLHLFAAGLQRRPYGSNGELLAALARGEVDAALVWAPALARLAAAGRPLWPDAVVPDASFGGEMTTRFVLALRADEQPLLAQVNDALAAMRGEGFVRALAERYGLPPTEWTSEE